MILFLDAEAVPYEEIQNMLDRMREEGYQIAVVGERSKSELVERAAKQISADFHQCFEGRDGHSALDVFQGILLEGQAAGDESLVISNKGECLTAATILGAHFIWVIDLI